MNHTHYSLINEDNDVVAVIRKEDFKGRLIRAIEDETGEEVSHIDIEQIEYNSYKVTAVVYETSYTATLRPTWEY